MKNTIYSWFWIRHLSIFIDWVVTMLINILLWYIVWFTIWNLWSTDTETIKQVSFWISLLVWVSYFGLMHYYWWQTIGKMAMWIRVVNKWSLGNISFLQAILRFFATIISALPLMLWYIWPSWDKEKRSFHDMIAKTRVIEIRNTPVWIVVVWNIVVLMITILYIIITVYSMINMFQDPGWLQTINAVN